MTNEIIAHMRAGDMTLIGIEVHMRDDEHGREDVVSQVPLIMQLNGGDSIALARMTVPHGGASRVYREGGLPLMNHDGKFGYDKLPFFSHPQVESYELEFLPACECDMTIIAGVDQDGLEYLTTGMLED